MFLNMRADLEFGRRRRLDHLVASHDQVRDLLLDRCDIVEAPRGHRITEQRRQRPRRRTYLKCSVCLQRLGAVIEASDVRPAVKEQIESLGAKFLDVPFLTDEEREIAQGVGGYARPMPADWMRRQAELVHQRATQADIVITTALIPGRKAPVLLAEDTVKQMKPGSVVVDLAAAQGGNCPLTVPDEVVERHGVVLIGHTNLASMVAADASALYARNVLDFLKLIVDKDGRYTLNLEDDIVAACLMCKDGQVVRQAA